MATQNTNTQKVDGADLGYNIPRNYKTPLTDKELNYCVKDVAIVSEYMFYLFNNKRKVRCKMIKRILLETLKTVTAFLFIGALGIAITLFGAWLQTL